LTLHVKKIMSTEDIAKATGLTATEIDLLWSRSFLLEQQIVSK
jgi:hypothetical protein